jgi:folate-binding protein YgfZ
MTLDAPAQALAMPMTGATIVPLPSLGSLRFDGADAIAFLQAQLSSDVGKLAAGTLQRSSYVSPKGRVLANLVLWRTGREDAPLGALVAGDLAAATARRLSMFVLRANVKVLDAGPGRVRLGLAGPLGAERLRSLVGRAPAPGEAVEHDDLVLLGLPDGRVVIDADVARAATLREAFATGAGPDEENAWWLAQVRAGVPMVTAATTDQFVPQALNLDALGAVSFQKGCYPGQEIVARTQYLGRLKERLFAFGVTGPAPSPGARLFAASFGDQPCGTVVNAAAAEDGRCMLLAVAQRTAAQDDTLHLHTPDGPVLVPASLPYAVPEPAQPRGRMP